MTFTPIPKDELLPVGQLFDEWREVIREIASRLYHMEQAANWAAGQIAALYAALPDVLDAMWTYQGTDVDHDPGMGSVTVRVTQEPNRKFALSKMGFEFDELKQGSTVVLTDDPASPPVTAFRQYTITSEIIDRGSWVAFDAVRIATFGTLTTPTIGASVRLILR